MPPYDCYYADGKHPSWHVCGDASNGAEAIQTIDQLEPDVVVMDLSMPIMTGPQAATEIVKTHLDSLCH